MDPATISAILMALSAASSIGGGLFGANQPRETKIQKKQRQTIDELLGSLKGEGPYSSLFETDEAAFQKSYVDPAKQLFSSQIAPQIQQQYIASGQQRGTGLEDQLLRAGVDLDQLLNQQYASFVGQGKDRMQNILGSILSAGPGAQSPLSTGAALGQSVSGLLSNENFWSNLANLGKRPNQFQPQREGFTS